MSICWGANDFGQGKLLQSMDQLALTVFSGYDLANQTAYLDDMIRWTMDWLMKVCQL